MISPDAAAAEDLADEVDRLSSAGVWCVWTEWGEYEQFSRDLHGIFATEALAQAHADQIKGGYDKCEVIADFVLRELPTPVPAFRLSVRILPDGTAIARPGSSPEKMFDTWSNEMAPVQTAQVQHQCAGTELFIEVWGADFNAVSAEYERLLTAARDQLRERPR